MIVKFVLKFKNFVLILKDKVNDGGREFGDIIYQSFSDKISFTLFYPTKHVYNKT